MPDEKTLRAELVRRLGATVGIAKAQTAIEGACKGLAISDEILGTSQVAAVLDHLGTSGDLVGIAALLLKTQISLASRPGTPVPR